MEYVNEGLKLKAKNISSYLVERFNNDFNKDKNNTFKLSIKEAYEGRGYIIYFENKKIYFDIQLLPKYEEKGKNRILLLVTYYFFLLPDKTTKNDYYYYFLHIIRSLFNHQRKNQGIYECCPHCLYEINKKINSFEQVNILV